MVENDPISVLYTKDEDIGEEDKFVKEDKFDNPLLKNEIQDFINEEISEPDLMYFCKDDDKATSLLKKCIKWMNDKDWATMKNYLICNNNFIIIISSGKWRRRKSL
jgi:hypothetical protein